MKRIALAGLALVAVLAAGVGGYWAGLRGIPMPGIRYVLDAAPVSGPPEPANSEPVIYYRDPNGKPVYSATPRRTEDGHAFRAVRASEDVSFEDRPPATAEATGPANPRRVLYYRNPMGLPDTSPTPKKDSMGMDYIAVYEGEDSDDGSIKVSSGKIQRTGVESVAVGKHPITRTIKAPGVVELDERRITVIAPRYDGFVDSVGPVTTGTHVKRGEPLVTVFGNELLNQGARLIGDEGFSKSGSNGPSGAVVGAHRRLLNLGVPEEFIEQIKRERRVPDTLTVRAPSDGIVLERNVVTGQAFKAGDVLFRLADHSQVWMMADVSEGDIDALKAGQKVTVTTRAHPGRTFTGKVAVVYPHLMKETRTARVRIELPNPDLALLPNMYGDVEIGTGHKDDALAVPASAVIDSGSRRVVLLDQGDGRYEPRDVKLGRPGDGFVEILSGVAEGERVVVNGNFLIDAESNLRAALKGFTAPETLEAGR